MKNHIIELSVHQLVDFLLRKGDIDNRVFNRSSMTEGSVIHNLYQSQQGDDYISEYPLKTLFVIDEIQVIIQGRADGIIYKDGNYIIDEIKTTVIDLKEFREENLEWHIGQAKCYAYMFAKEKNLNNIGVRLTYIKQGKLSEKLLDNYFYIFSDLEREIYDLIEEYIKFYNIVLRLEEKRNESIKDLQFPFEKFRDGQRELAKYSYSIALKGGQLFAEAPTGIGKTMSTIYPFIKSLTEDDKTKIFYLTAKNSGKLNALNAVNILKKKGLSLVDILITAKEKICFNKEAACNPDECPFAKGYYNKIKQVLKESLLAFDTFDYETVVSIAKTYNVCPFELELDLSLFSDVIICDYNYMFDPISYMKRYFDDDSSHYLALVDEAHNLVDRSKSMYSASLSQKMFLEAKKSLTKSKNKKLKNQMGKLKKLFEPYSELSIANHELMDLDVKQYRTIDNFVDAYLDVSKNTYEDITKELTKFYLEVSRFKKITEFMSDKFLYYVNKSEDEITLNIVCLDASMFLRDIFKRIKGSVLFSATLSPLSYYIPLLGGDKKTPNITLSSPFPKENLKVMVAPKISTKYSKREKNYQEVANYIEAFVSQKVGNYFVYLPSYEYLDNLLGYLAFPEDVDFKVQSRGMSEIEKEKFLDSFTPNPSKTHVGLVIVGGAFGEGIDLVSDRLIGVAIVGIGLSKISFENDKVSQYYKNNGLNGFNFAYLYPGMNKIMQAVGRLIRSETDKGMALLLDERYMTREYQDLYRSEWKDYEVVISVEDMIKTIQKFIKMI